MITVNTNDSVVRDFSLCAILTVTIQICACNRGAVSVKIRGCTQSLILVKKPDERQKEVDLLGVW